VLLHGLTGTWRNWLRVLPALEAEHEVFAPTLPGHCGGPPLASGVTASVGALADALETELDRAGFERAHLVGNSLGGWLALELARRGRARTVVALAPGGAWRDARDLRRVTRIIRGSHGAVRVMAPHLEGLLRRPRTRRALLRYLVARPDVADVQEVLDALNDAAACTVVQPLLAAIARDGQLAHSPATCPIVIAWPEHDRLLKLEQYGRPLLALVPGAELVVLPGLGHAPMYDDPGVVADTILEVTRAADRNGG
jgi:pimeloyl-ACP methyl ester carboxylesterase